MALRRLIPASMLVRFVFMSGSCLNWQVLVHATCQTASDQKRWGDARCWRWNPANGDRAGAKDPETANPGATRRFEWPSSCSSLVVASQYLGRLALSMIALAGSGPVLAQSPDEYRLTESALERYRVLAAEDDGAILPSTPKPVEPGQHYAGIPRLIRLLRLVGDLPAGTSLPDSDLYDSDLVTAVKRFQVPPWTRTRRAHRQNHPRAIEHAARLPGAPTGTGAGALAAASVRPVGSGDRAESARIPAARLWSRAPSRARDEHRGSDGPKSSGLRFCRRKWIRSSSARTGTCP